MPVVEDVYAALRTVYDPEIPVNLVDLGLIYTVETEADKVRITMTLTTPGCGMARQIALNAKHSVMEKTNCGDVLVTVTFDPPWDPSRISEEGRQRIAASKAGVPFKE